MLKQRIANRTRATGGGSFIDGTTSINAQFSTQIESLTVDNYSGRWLRVTQEGLFIPPYTLGWVGNLYGSKLAIQVALSAPSFTNPLGSGWVNIEGEVVCSFYDEPLAPSNGYSIAPAWYPYLSAAPQYYATTFRTLGNGAVEQFLLSIQNNNVVNSATLIIGIRRVTITMDATVASLAVKPIFRIGQFLGSTGGTILGKLASMSGLGPTSDATVVVRGATASDGGAATPITGTIGNTTGRESFGSRMATVAGEAQSLTQIELWTPQDSPIMIAPGFGSYSVKVNAAAAADNPTTNHYLTEIMWEEYKLS